jgi:hypothetical protein
MAAHHKPAQTKQQYPIVLDDFFAPKMDGAFIERLTKQSRISFFDRKLKHFV